MTPSMAQMTTIFPQAQDVSVGVVGGGGGGVGCLERENAVVMIKSFSNLGGSKKRTIS